MKLLFIVTGVGFGDSTREHTNILAVKKKYPKAKIMVACYDNSYNYFKDKYETIRIGSYVFAERGMRLRTIPFLGQMIYLPFAWGLSTLKLKLHTLNFKPDLIISDFEAIGVMLSRITKAKCLTVFSYDPELYKEYKKEYGASPKLKFQTHHFEKVYDKADLAIIPSLRIQKPRKLRYTYINPIIRETPDKLGTEKKLMKELKLKKKPILVMLGGSKIGTKLAEDLNKMAKSFKEDFIIFGGHLEGIDFVKNIQYHNYIPHFLEYLKVCKGIITLAGSKTLSEALVYKKPIMCFPIFDHGEQITNAYSIKDIAHVHYNTKDLKKKIKAFIKDMPKLQRKVNKYNIKSNGAQQFVKLVEIALQE
tara:strand:+ start:1509 stop:2597 length:1089 start_codon:yes stop_codon:yes gene_type:complete